MRSRVGRKRRLRCRPMPLGRTGMLAWPGEQPAVRQAAATSTRAASWRITMFPLNRQHPGPVR